MTSRKSARGVERRLLRKTLRRNIRASFAAQQQRFGIYRVIYRRSTLPSLAAPFPAGDLSGRRFHYAPHDVTLSRKRRRGVSARDKCITSDTSRSWRNKSILLYAWSCNVTRQIGSRARRTVRCALHNSRSAPRAARGNNNYRAESILKTCGLR